MDADKRGMTLALRVGGCRFPTKPQLFPAQAELVVDNI